MVWENPYPDTRFDLLGVEIHRLTRSQLLDCFAQALEAGESLHFAYLNVAVSNQARDDARTAELLSRADLVYVDGAGIRLGCWLLGTDCPPRNTGADFFPEVMALCAQMGKSVGFLGGTPGGASRQAELLRARFPDLRITFIEDGYQGLQNETSWLPRLQIQPPALLLVGLGVPRQEEWIATHRGRLGNCLYWSVGALFEYDTGSLSRCPAWMGKMGLEWLYRLLSEPRRLWKRYLIGNPRFLLRCLCSRWRGRAATH